MPKKYRIDMTITDTETNTQVDSSVLEETYENDAEAQSKFSKKVDAAEKAGKPDKP